ncbi:beta-ketoacyl-ACP synthase III [Guyparkeria halophila]|uniref:Beta-ketoacyl-[acyl-carrier-protein] synthase III n=1 Tax=Guyparkeria halophila TaxID=47960 RepID=A0A6I6D5U1_9GAMM|nr:beta-ketoacyl-ACP synthase III [Guyparkeria halophila]QGT79637.1 beta-ketoacyl-ACP synthase III [Guyparkeria halophila]
MTYSRITGTGSYLPERVMTNRDLEQIVDTSDSWIRERTGIEQRHIAADGQLTSDLAEPAARRALEAAGRVPEEVDLIIVATTTPDRTFPSTACLLQQKLGIHGPPAFDVQAVCTGFVYALSVADKFIKTGAARCALVVGAETLSRIVNWSDRNTCVLFADGAGAVVLEASGEPGIIRTDIHADGSYESLLTTAKPDPETTDPERLADGTAFIEMRGNEVFRMAVNTLGRIVDQTVEAAGMSPDEIDWLVPHQANIRIIQATARKLGMSMDRVVVTVDRHGNTSAASVPLALDAAVRDGRIKRGDVILTEAFGGGFTWGSALLRY